MTWTGAGSLVRDLMPVAGTCFLWLEQIRRNMPQEDDTVHCIVIFDAQAFLCSEMRPARRKMPMKGKNHIPSSKISIKTRRTRIMLIIPNRAKHHGVDFSLKELFLVSLSSGLTPTPNSPRPHLGCLLPQVQPPSS